MHDVLDGAHNPVMLVMLATFALLALVFSSIVGMDWLEGSESEAFLTTVATAIAPAYTGPVGLLYGMSEEYERGVPATLARAGVTTAQVAVGKLVSSLAWTLVAVLIACIVLGYPADKTAGVLAVSIPASLPTLLMSLAFGLLADDQTKGSVFAVPIVVFAVMPLLGTISDELRTIACVLPAGFAAEVSCLMAGMPTRLPLAVAVCLCVAWTAIGTVLVFWAHRRYADRVAAMVDRIR